MMFAAERLREIVSLARRHGRVDVKGLASGLGVTAETIRRDLTELEDRGLLRRVWGGAIPIEIPALEAGFGRRPATMTAEKHRIAQRALAEIRPARTVLLDAGTTTALVAELLPPMPAMTFLTHAPSIAVALAAKPGQTVLMIGGQVRPTTLAAVGPWALGQLENIQADLVFVATNGITAERGLTTPNHDEAAVKRSLVKAGKRVVVLADHTKLGMAFFEQFASLEDIDLLITDTGADPTMVAELERAGLKVVVA